MKKRKILFLYSSSGFGGIVRNLSLLVKNLDQDKFTPIVIGLIDSDDSAAKLSRYIDEEISTHYLQDSSKLSFRAIREINNLIEKNEIDILSCHGHKADVYGFFIRVFLRNKIPLTTIAHGWVTPGLKMSFYYFLDKLAMRFFDHIVLVSQQQINDLKRFGIPLSKTSVIYNAIDAAAFRNSSSRIVSRSSLEIPEDCSLIGFFGRLSGEKSIETTLLALGDLQESSIHFLVAGEGAEQSNLQKLSDKLGIKDRVHFIGYQAEIAALYPLLDIYITSSKKEGLPNNLLEAQAFGLPCIASDIPGNNEIIKDGHNGMLFKFGDSKGLTKQIESLVDNQSLREKLGQQASSMVKSKFSLDERMKKLEKLYLSLISPD